MSKAYRAWSVTMNLLCFFGKCRRQESIASISLLMTMDAANSFTIFQFCVINRLLKEVKYTFVIISSYVPKVVGGELNV